MFRYYNKNVPELFNSYLEYNSDYHNYNTRSAHLFHAPQIKTDLAKTRLKYRWAIIWNAVQKHCIYFDTSESILIKFLELVCWYSPMKVYQIFLYMYILSLSSYWLSFFCYLHSMPDIRIPQIMSVFSLYLLLDALMTVYLGQMELFLSATLIAPSTVFMLLLNYWKRWSRFHCSSETFKIIQCIYIK